MMPNYLRTTLRYLWRKRLFTALNILGLSIGLCAAFVIFRLVDYELSFDRAFADADDYVQVAIRNKSANSEGGVTIVAMGLAPRIEQQVAGIDDIIPMYYHPDKAHGMDRRVATLPAYFEMVRYHWLAGDRATAVAQPNQVVLTRSRAERYYPKEEPADLIGKTIDYDENKVMTISGIVEDLPYNTSFDAQEFFRIAQEEWPDDLEFGWRQNCLLFLKLHQGASQERVLQQINAINEERNGEHFESLGSSYWYTFIPINKRHYAADYYSPLHRTVNSKVFYGLAGIAAFLLLLAIINYVNLSTALMPHRAREIGVRRTLGGVSHQLAWRFVGETVCVAVLALAVSLGMQHWVIALFSAYFPEGMVDYLDYPRAAVYLAGLVSLIALLSGIYPAWLLTRINVVEALKGKVDRIGEGISFRRVLIVFQFVIAQVFVVGALVIGLQLRYTLTKDLGFRKDAVVTVGFPTIGQEADSLSLAKQLLFQQSLSRHPGVVASALGDLPMGSSLVSYQTEFVGPSGPITMTLAGKMIGEGWMDLYEMHLVSGRQPRIPVEEIVINESAAKAAGYPSAAAAVGELVENQRIVGVVADFHLYGLKAETMPVKLSLKEPGERAGNINIRLVQHNWPATLAKISEEWASLYPETPFDYQFYDERIQQMHEQDHRLARVVNYSAVVTILIGCLGLFGLATLVSFQRMKEIGIRKVLGASVAGIVRMLASEFVKLVLVSVVVASPIAWWVMNQWLENFAYRIDIQWWVFALAGSAAVAIALLTVSWQALRAAVANPVDSLRDE